MTKITALVPLNKRKYYFFNSFEVPFSDVIRYPILLSSLIARIQVLYSTYSLPVSLRVYHMSLSLSRANAREDLKGLGGVYI